MDHCHWAKGLSTTLTGGHRRNEKTLSSSASAARGARRDASGRHNEEEQHGRTLSRMRTGQPAVRRRGGEGGGWSPAVVAGDGMPFFLGRCGSRRGRGVGGGRFRRFQLLAIDFPHWTFQRGNQYCNHLPPLPPPEKRTPDTNKRGRWGPEEGRQEGHIRT
jgi:hypothetical protein